MSSERTERTGQRFNVCLLGVSLDDCNMGLRALAASLIGLIHRARPEARFFLLYGNRAAGQRQVEAAGGAIPAEVVNYRLSPRARLQEHLLWILMLACLWRLLPARTFRNWLCRKNRWLAALAGSDLTGSVHGGDSFSDIYGFRRLLVTILPDLTALLLGKKLVLLPQTYGPFKSRAGKLLGRFIIRRSARLYARDRQSLTIARMLLGANKNHTGAFYCPDAAFALEPVPADLAQIRPPLDRPAIEILVGLNVSGLLYMGGFTRGNMFGLSLDYPSFARRLAQRLLEEDGVHLLLVPHVLKGAAESDTPACREVWRGIPEEYRQRVHLLTGDHDQSRLKHVIGQCDFFIGSRMHACIAALSQGIPCAGVAYSRKFAGVFSAAGAEDLALDARRAAADELIGQCLELFRSRDLVRRRLAARLPAIGAQLSRCFAAETADSSQAPRPAAERPEWRRDGGRKSLTGAAMQREWTADFKDPGER